MAHPIDILQGIEIISKYSNSKELTNDNFQADHEQIWCCKYSNDKMTKYEQEIMKELGWFENEGAWSHFT